MDKRLQVQPLLFLKSCLGRGHLKDTTRNFLTKNNTAPAGIKRAKRSSK